jgi:preprotein translocase subunit SecD
MRRFFGYLTLILTIFFAAIFSVQGQINNLNFGLEYSQGYETAYRVEFKDNASNMTTEDVAHIVEQRLEDAQVRNSNVYYEATDNNNGGDNAVSQIKVRINAASETSLDYILRSVEATGTITVSTLMDGGEYGKEIENPFVIGSAKVDWSNNQPYVKVDVANYDEFNTFISACNDAYKAFQEKYNSDNSNESTIDGVVVIWLNKTAEDSYIEAYQNEDPVIQEQMKKKILSIVPTSYFQVEKNSNSEVTSAKLLIDRYDYDQVTMVGESAHTIERLLNYQPQDYTLTRLYTHTLTAEFNTIYQTLAIVGLGTCMLAVCIFLCVKYGLAGSVGVVGLSASTLLSLLVFNYFSYQVTTMVILAFAISIGFNLLMLIPYFETFKDELYKGKTPSKAHVEAFRSSRWTVIDGTIAALIVGIISIFVSINQVKLLPITLVINCISIFILTRLILRWGMWWLTSSAFAEKHLGMFMVKDKDVPNVVKDEKQTKFNALSNVDFSTKGKVSGIVASVVALVSAIAIIIVTFVPAFGGTFRYSSEFSENTVIEVQTEVATTSYLFDSEKSVREFFEKETDLKVLGVNITRKDKVIISGREDKPNINYVTITLDGKYDITAAQVEEITNKIHALDVPGSDEAVVGVANATTVTPSYILTYSIIALIMFGLIASVYYLIRFGYMYGLASLATVVPSGLLAVAFFSVTRISTSPLVLMGIAAGLFIGALSQLPLIERAKKLMRESKNKNKNLEFRQEQIKQAAKDAMHITLKISCLSAVTFVIIAAFLPVNFYSVFGGGLIAIASTTVLTLFLFVPIVLALEKVHMNLKAKRAQKNLERREKSSKAKMRRLKEEHKNLGSEPTESIIPGIND